MASVSTDRRFGVVADNARKSPCKAATTANITLSGEQTIDGVSCVTDDRVLVKNQTTASENGIYYVDTSSWTRAPDWDGAYDVVQGTIVYVNQGTANIGHWKVTTSGTITIGATSVAFAATDADSVLREDIEAGLVSIPEWIDPLAATRASTTTFTTADSSICSVGQRFKATGGADRYGRILSLVDATTVEVEEVKDSSDADSTLHASMTTVSVNVAKEAFKAIDFSTHRTVNMRKYITSGSGTTADPYILDATAIQAHIDANSNVLYVYDPGKVWQHAALTVTSTGRSTDSSLGTIYRAGIYFHFTGAVVQPAAAVANLFTFTDVSDFGVKGTFFNGTVTGSFVKVNSSGTAVRNFYISVNRMKGGATSGAGTDGVGVLLDSTSGNIAAFQITAKGGMWTHLKDGIYMKNDTPGSGIDTGIIENITTWPYGGSAAIGYGIRCEAAVDVIFRRIYGGLFEWDNSAAIYLQPTYSSGIRNCKFEVVSADVSSSKTSCKTIKGLVNDSAKPIEGCTFSQIKMYKAASGTTGNNVIAITTSGTPTGEFRYNEMSGIWSNDTSGADALSLGAGCHDNSIIPTGNFDKYDLPSWITDAGYNNVIQGHNETIRDSQCTRATATAGGDTTLKTKTITGGSMGANDGLRIFANAYMTTNANGITIVIKIDGNTVSTITVASGATLCRLEADMFNLNSKTAQYVYGRAFSGTTIAHHGITTPAVDTTADFTVTVVATLAGSPGSDSVSCDQFVIERIAKPTN